MGDSVWTSVESGDGRTYFWNTHTDETSWVRPSSPWKKEIRLENETIEGLCTIARVARLNTALQIGICASMKRLFDVWRTFIVCPSRVNVRMLSDAIEGQLVGAHERRVQLCVMTEEVRRLETELHDAKLDVQAMLKETLAAKLRAATIEYDCLKKNVRPLSTCWLLKCDR